MQVEAQPSRIQLAFRALRHQSFRLFVYGQLISLIGTWMQNVAQAWLVYRLTGSSLLLGSIGFAQQVPLFVLAPWAGIVADRYSRHKIVIATQVSSMVLAAILAVLTLTGTVQLWHIFVLGALLGVVNAFDVPARQSFLVEMVGRDDLMNAIALNSSMFNGARVIGPAIAGVLVATIGEGWCFLVNAVSYVAVLIGLFRMDVHSPHRPSIESPIDHLVEGFSFVARTAPIRALILLLSIAALVAMPYAVLLPIFADRILHGGPRGYGILLTATGIGALLGALTLAFRSGLKGLGRWIALCSGTFGIALAIFAFSRSFVLSAALLVPIGFTMMLQMSASNTLIQAMVPDRLRGRVMGVYSMMFLGMAPFGALLSGWAAERLGPQLAVAIGGAACILAAAVFGTRLPRLRVEARQLILAQQLAAGTPADVQAIAGGSSGSASDDTVVRN